MISFLKSNSIFKDRQAVMLMTTGMVIAVGTLLFVLIFNESREFKVDVRYSGYDRSLSDKGNWYTLYVFPLFAILTHFVNSYLSLKAHAIQRTMAITILGLNIVVQVFAFAVSKALIDLL